MLQLLMITSQGLLFFFAKNDVNKDNVRILSESIQDISESKMAINELYNDFSASQINQFTVKWIDGRQMSLGNWKHFLYKSLVKLFQC